MIQIAKFSKSKSALSDSDVIKSIHSSKLKLSEFDSAKIFMKMGELG